ncbi:hypothetical protein Vretifemale_20765 [Volvox reticuliferus]|uniref:HECT domain-containing protein n=1 Tax=Volvox reticuliferus TaxID=1737510 RepID=A0A8J4D745_9CHLO|nr:hypothetical protein Vretifemale_20765 [Volvox reticuliferus]
MATGDSSVREPPATPNLGQLVRSGVRLMVWGRSDMGQLGVQALGGSDFLVGSISTPTQLEALKDKDVVGLAGGAFHVAFVTADGELFTAGCNDNGQLGRRTSGGSSSARPTHVTALESYNVVAAGCGATHTMVLTNQGGVLGWGGNEFGQTGCGSEGPDQHHPRPIKGLGDQRVVRLAVGANHALLLTGSGSVFAVGQGSFGALGQGEGLLENRSTLVPVLPLMPLGVVQVAAGENHSAALTADGRLYTWGRGKYGQLGHGDWGNRPRPVLVASLRGVRAKQVSCGGDHTLVLAEAGTGGAGADADSSTCRGLVYSFGRGTWGATGLGSTDNICRPSRVQGLESENVVQVSAGSRHSLALSASHKVFAFGNNDFGQLGLDSDVVPNGRGPATFHSGSGDGLFLASPRRLTSLPAVPVLAVLASGDASMVLLQEARPGEIVLAGPHPGRRAGRHLMPYDVPDLRHLAAAAATASEDARMMRDVVTAVEDVMSSPGYLLALFADGKSSCSTSGSHTGKTALAPSQRSLGAAVTHGSTASISTLEAATTAADSDKAGAEGVGVSGGSIISMPVGMDVSAIQACFEALLRLYNREVVAALGNSLMRLLDAIFLLASTGAVPGSRPPSGSGPGGLGGITGGSGGNGARSVLGATTAASAAGASLRSFGVAAAAGAGDGAGAGDSVASGRLSLLRALFVVFQCPLLSGSGMGLGLSSSLASRLISVTLRLPGDALQLLCTWLVSLPRELLGGRVVRPLQHYLNKLAEGPMAPDGRAEVLAAARMMAGLHAANEKAGGKLPFSEFYNQQLSTHVNLRSEYLLWLEVAGGRSTPPPGSSTAAISQPLVSLCQTPFLLTPEAKSRILQGEAHIQKEAEMNASAREALLQGLHPIYAVFLDISVRRASILADTAQQLASRPPHHLKRPLRVSFVSQGVAEEGVDQGGVSREFFQLLVAEIFQPQYGMFTYSDESRTFWFNTSACLEDGAAGEFRLVGVVLGLAIYNGVILDVHFPQTVYKKLLGEPVGLPDLEEAFPTLGRSLRAVLAMDPDQVEDALCRNFEVQYDYFGEQRTVPLIPGGTSIPVTGANRAQYVQRLVEWTLNESVETQFRAFAYGFHQVCGGPALSLFRHEELELLICGLPHLDFGALEANARYEGGYHRQHPTIVMLWQLINEMDLDQKRRFLSFTTGCDRAPVAGLGALVLVIQRAGPDTDRLPTAHTCFNALVLPEYSSRSKMKAKLQTAIENAQGFGLK